MLGTSTRASTGTSRESVDAAESLLVPSTDSHTRVSATFLLVLTRELWQAESKVEGNKLLEADPDALLKAAETGNELQVQGTSLIRNCPPP